MRTVAKGFFVLLTAAAFLTSGPLSPQAYGAGQTLKASVFRYEGDLAGWQDLELRKGQGQAWVPLRRYADSAGFTVSYDAATRRTSVESVKTRLELKPGSKTATVNGQKQTMPAALRVIGGTSWISVDYLAKVFPAVVEKYAAGYAVRLQESYWSAEIGGERFILHDQTGDLYVETPDHPQPAKIASLDRKVNLPKLTAEKTENGNYFVSVEELYGDGAIFSHEVYTSLYIRDGQEADQYSTTNYPHNLLHRYQGQIVFVKDGTAAFIDDRTGETVRSVPFRGGGLVDIQDGVWVTKYDGYGLYVPETDTFTAAYELLPDPDDRGAVQTQVQCPVSPRCGGLMAYKGREGDRLVFTFSRDGKEEKRVYYDLTARQIQSDTSSAVELPSKAPASVSLG